MRNTRLRRQSFLGPGSEEILDAATVAIIGFGGGGSQIGQQLAHIGVGNFHIFDPDVFEDTNHNRLVGALFSDIKEGTSKIEIARRLIAGINPKARIHIHCCDWRERAEVLRDCDVVFGCVDSYSARAEIEVYTRRYLIPLIDVGMDVFESENRFAISGQVILSMPDQVCMRCLGFITEARLAREAEAYGAAGGRPQVIWPNGVLASSAVGLFMQLLTPWCDTEPGPIFLEYDGNSQSVSRSPVLDHLAGKKCDHFGSVNDLGDPFFHSVARSHSVFPTPQAKEERDNQDS